MAQFVWVPPHPTALSARLAFFEHRLWLVSGELYLLWAVHHSAAAAPIGFGAWGSGCAALTHKHITLCGCLLLSRVQEPLSCCLRLYALHTCQCPSVQAGWVRGSVCWRPACFQSWSSQVALGANVLHSLAPPAGSVLQHTVSAAHAGCGSHSVWPQLGPELANWEVCFCVCARAVLIARRHAAGAVLTDAACAAAGGCCWRVDLPRQQRCALQQCVLCHAGY